MPYFNVTAQTLYQSCIAASPYSSGHSDPFEKARAWVEAENIEAVWKLVQKWFLLMQSGEAEMRYPDPTWSEQEGRAPLTPELADMIVKELDADFEVERGRFQGRRPPEFARLSAVARLAFAQDLLGILKTDQTIRAEAKDRLAAGEVLPPLPAHVPGAPSSPGPYEEMGVYC